MKPKIDRVALTTAGLEMMTLGYRMIVSGGSKGNNPSVLGKGWQEVRPTANEFVTAVEQSRVTGIGANTTNLCVFDLDMKNGIDGIGNFFRFVAENDPEFKHDIDAASCAETPTEGLHYYFGDPTGEVANSVGKIAPGVDVRGVGGFIAMPPTVRPGIGKYEWIQNPRPVSELIPAPDWLKGTANTPTGERIVGSTLWKPKDTDEGTTEAAKFAYEVGQAPTGERNATLYHYSRACGHLVVEGELTYATAVTVLSAGARASGLSEHEIHATIDSGLLSVMDMRATAITTLVEERRAER